MLDIAFIRENKKLVEEKSKQKGYPVDVKKLLLLEGENEIEIIAIDKAGNRTKKLIKVKYSR